MGKIRMRRTAFSDNPELKAPVFNFSRYVADGEHTYYNNEEQIDFVTDGNSLYVCLSHDGVTPTYENIEDQADFLKLVSQGPQGIRGPRGYDGDSAETPRLSAEFDNDQLRVYINGEVQTVSPRLTGKSWRPKLEDNMLVWELSNKMYAPEPIDLEDLRPIQEKPLLLRVDSDNTKRTDEKSGPARFIQWKYEGDQHWTNLISISELMNLTLAGITIFPVENTETGKTEYHLGHKEVLEATYDSDKDGHRIISNVELGHVLFDAGPIPIGEGSNGDDNDFQTQIDLILAELAGIKTGLVKSVSINGGTHIAPTPDGNVDLAIGAESLEGLATEAWVGANYQPKGNYVKAVKLNGTTYNPNSTTGLVDLGTISGGSGGGSVNTDDCVKSVTINGETKTPVNGNVEFTISVGGLTSFDVKIENNTLYKKVNGGSWVPCGSVTGGGDNPSSGLTESEVKHIIGQILEGVLDSAIPEYVRTSGHNYFVRINELNSILNDYATKNWVLEQLAGYDPDNPGQITITSYRTFTIYKWYSIDANPAIPVLPTSASWDGTSNGLTLVGNTNNWTDHPGNRPNDSARLWMATITLKSDGTSSSDWSGPIDLTAYPGKDGNGVEFIYTLCVNETAFKALATPQAVHGDGRDDDYPAHWTDTPQSIGTYSAADNIETFYNFNGNEEVLFRIEAASIRTFKNEQWGEYCKPFIWSMWGEDGLDGNGVEYIFFLTDGENGVVTESNGVYSLNQNNWPDNSWAYEYQAPNSGWTDDPTGVSASTPYEFVSKRKYHMDSQTRQGAWSNWSEPALWSIYKEGPQGPGGGPGPTGPRGDDYEKVYGLAGNSLPGSKSIDATQEDANGKTSADDGYLPKFVFGEVSVDATATPQGVSSTNRYEFESIRRKHDGVWGPFSAPALHSNFVEAGLTDEQLENIKNDVEDAIGEDIADAQQRLTDAEGRLDNIDGENSRFLQDNASSLVQILTNYEDGNQKSFADLIVDGKKATIEQWAGSKVANDLGEESLVSVKNQLDGINGVIGNYADYKEGDELKTVKQLLDAKAATAEISATYATKQSVTDARTEWNAEVGVLQSSVAKATYVWVKYDGDGNVVDVQPFNGESSKAGYTKELSANAMTAIRQSASEVDIVAGVADNWAQIIAKADEDGSSIILDADHINLVGDASADRIAINHAEITDAEISNATITDATITDCTINSSIESDNYNNVNKTGFMIDPEGGDFAFYADNAKFDSDNGLVFSGTQTISWNNVTDKPNIPDSLEDIDTNNVLSTFITRSSLTTNKITASEIDSTNLHVSAANVDGQLSVGSLQTSTGSNGVSTKIQEGVFEISGCGNAKIAFGVDGNCVPYMYLTDANGNEIWRATNQGFNFSGTIVPQMIAAYPGNGHLLKSITVSNGKISPYSFTYQNSGTSYEYDKTSSFSQYYVIRPGFVIKGSSYTRPDVKDGGGIATGGMIIGYFQPNYYSTKLVDFDQVNVTTNVPLDAFIFKDASNMCNPSSSNAIYNGYYVSSPQLALIEDGVNNYIYGEGHGSLNIRFYLPIIHITNGHIDSVENVYYYPNEEAYHQFDGETVNLTDEDPWW